MEQRRDDDDDDRVMGVNKMDEQTFQLGILEDGGSMPGVSVE